MYLVEVMSANEIAVVTLTTVPKLVRRNPQNLQGAFVIVNLPPLLARTCVVPFTPSVEGPRRPRILMVSPGEKGAGGVVVSSQLPSSVTSSATTKIPRPVVSMTGNLIP